MSKNMKKLRKQGPFTTPLLEIVMLALKAKWYIPDEAPHTDDPHLTRDTLRALKIKKLNGGYVANLTFEVPLGRPDTIGTPDAHPLPKYRDAFLAGAKLVSEIVTGSQKLPFLVLGNELVVATVLLNGKPLMMRRPFPTQLV